MLCESVFCLHFVPRYCSSHSATSREPRSKLWCVLDPKAMSIILSVCVGDSIGSPWKPFMGFLEWYSWLNEHLSWSGEINNVRRIRENISMIKSLIASFCSSSRLANSSPSFLFASGLVIHDVLRISSTTGRSLGLLRYRHSSDSRCVRVSWKWKLVFCCSSCFHRWSHDEVYNCLDLFSELHIRLVVALCTPIS